MIKSIRELFLLVWFFLGICGCQLNLSTSEMGYCFDAGLDEVQNRLYIAAGKAGIHTLGVDHGQLTFISTFYDAGYYRNLIIHNGTAYVADTDRGLVVLDITGDIPKPVWVQGENQGTGIAIEHNLLYLSTGDGNLDIFDISLPRLPKLIQQVDNFDQPWDVWVFDGIAYVADVNKGVEIIDVSMPSAPQRIGSISWDPEEPMAEVIAGEAGFIYIAAGKHGLVVIDVINPGIPASTPMGQAINFGKELGEAAADISRK